MLLPAAARASAAKSHVFGIADTLMLVKKQCITNHRRKWYNNQVDRPPGVIKNISVYRSGQADQHPVVIRVVIKNAGFKVVAVVDRVVIVCHKRYLRLHNIAIV